MTDAQGEPDYRMSLAAERTYLAYLRTGLALIAAGIGIVAALPHAGGKPLRRIIGLVLILTGAVVFVAARHRWRAVDKAMRRGEPLPPVLVVQSLSWILLAAALAVAVLVVFV